MKRTSTWLALFGLLLPLAGSAQAPVWLWATGLKGSASVQMRDITSSSDNGCFTLGWFSVDLHLPFDTLLNVDGTSPYFVAHVDTLGAVTWAAQFSDRAITMHGLPNDGLSCLIPFVGSTMVNGQLITATTTGHAALLVKFDSDGSIISMNNIALTTWPAETSPTQIVHHAEGGGIVLAGTFTDSVSIAGTWLYGEGLYLARFTEQGALTWAERIGCGTVYEGGLHIDAMGRVLVGVPLGCDPDPEGPFYEEGALASFGSNGDYEWHQPYVLQPFGGNAALTRRMNGNALVTSAFYGQDGSCEIGTHEFDGMGQEIWANYVESSTTFSYPTCIHALENGSTLLGGIAVGVCEFGPSITLGSGFPDGFIALTNGSGTWQWATSETSGNLFWNHIAPGTNSRIYTSGFSDTGLAFGGHSIASGKGNFIGYVACLGDVALSTGSSTADLDPLTLWPNPATRVLQTSFNLQASPLRIIDPCGRSVADQVGRPSASTLDISRLAPGAYLLISGGRAARFIKE